MNEYKKPRFEIIKREDFSDVTFLVEVRHPMMARAAQPGQFVIVMSHPEGERIPLTIADFDRDLGTITLVIQAVGKSTKEMQQSCKVGTSLYAMVGPMGTEFYSARRECNAEWSLQVEGTGRDGRSCNTWGRSRDAASHRGFQSYAE